MWENGPELLRRLFRLLSLVLHSRAPPKEERHVRDETRDSTT